MVGIYIIRSISNNKVYIGQSYGIESRINKHLRCLRNGNHINKHLQSTYNIYGEDNFKFDVVETLDNNVDNEIITEREQYWIDFYKSNIREFGFNKRGAGSKGRLSDETKLRIKLSNMCKCVSDETRRRISESKKGIVTKNRRKIGEFKWSDEQREKFMNTMRNKEHAFNKGLKVHTEETKKIISDKKRGVKLTLETRKKISKSVLENYRNKKQ